MFVQFSGMAYFRHAPSESSLVFPAEWGVHEGCLCRGRVVPWLPVVRASGGFLGIFGGNLLDVGRIVSDIDCGDETIPETWKGKR